MSMPPRNIKDVEKEFTCPKDDLKCKSRHYHAEEVDKESDGHNFLVRCVICGAEGTIKVSGGFCGGLESVDGDFELDN